MNIGGDLQRSGIDVFWGEIAPCEHLVQIYADDGVFLDSLEGFLRGGIMAGDGVLVIATAAHLTAVEDRLKVNGFDVDAARSRDQYIPLDAEQTLSKFMIGGWPDDDLFKDLVTELIARAGRDGRRVRAFGEMVAVLWARGDNGATVRLERLWHKLCQEEPSPSSAHTRGLVSLRAQTHRSGRSPPCIRRWSLDNRGCAPELLYVALIYIPSPSRGRVRVGVGF